MVASASVVILAEGSMSLWIGKEALVGLLVSARGRLMLLILVE